MTALDALLEPIRHSPQLLEVVEQYRLAGDGFELLQKSTTGELRSEVVEGFVAPISSFYSEEENVKALRTLLADQ